MTPSKSQRPPFFRLLREGYELSKGLAPRCLLLLAPLLLLRESLLVLWIWLTFGQFGEVTMPMGMMNELGIFQTLILALPTLPITAGVAMVGWITVRKMEGEDASLSQAFQRLREVWRPFLTVVFLFFVLASWPQWLNKIFAFLTSIDANFLICVFLCLQVIFTLAFIVFYLRLLFVTTIPMVESLGVIESAKRSYALIKGNTWYVLLLFCSILFLHIPSVTIHTVFNTNMIEGVFGYYEDVFSAISQQSSLGTDRINTLSIEIGPPWSPAALISKFLGLLVLLYSSVTTAALYQHLRKAKPI